MEDGFRQPSPFMGPWNSTGWVLPTDPGCFELLVIPVLLLTLVEQDRTQPTSAEKGLGAAGGLWPQLPTPLGLLWKVLQVQQIQRRGSGRGLEATRWCVNWCKRTNVQGFSGCLSVSLHHRCLCCSVTL